MPAAPMPIRHDKFNALYESRTEIALERRYWQAVQGACKNARNANCDDARWGFVPAFLRKLEATLRDYTPPRINHPGNLGNWSNPECIPVEGKVCNWIALAELISAHGDSLAQWAGRSMVVPCSQILFGGERREDGE